MSKIRKLLKDEKLQLLIEMKGDDSWMVDDSSQQGLVTACAWLRTRQGVMTREEILLLRVIKKVTTREDPQLASFDLKSFILHSNKSQTPCMHQFKAKNMYETYKQ